ncbi:MAG: hypothetical protein KIT09_34015 [Bryobacteraceae bacterium]|nr:hypothetical protein [Bryobacteraceae bacterium]
MTTGRHIYWLRQVALGAIVRRVKPAIYFVAFLWRRLLFRTTFIAITGSLGKTTAKECLAGILSSVGPTYRTYRNQNGPKEGVPLNILKVRPWHRFAVLEVGVGEPNTMGRVARLVRPDVAIVLNVKRAHTNTFVDLEQYAAEKSVLLRSLPRGGLAILCRDDQRVARMGEGFNGRIRYFGQAPEADYSAAQVCGAWPGRLSFAFKTPAAVQPVKTQFVGLHWLNSALAALAAADSLGVHPHRAAAALADVEPFPGRLLPVRLPNGAIVLRDDFSASIDSVEEAFCVLESASATRRIAVVTDVSDTGMNRRQRLRRLAGRSARAAEVAVFIGRNAEFGKRQAIQAGMQAGNVHAFARLREAADFLRAELRSGDLMLLKGRSTEHVSRIFWAQLGSIRCWKEYCPKRMLCDICWELDVTPEQRRLASAIVAPEIEPGQIRDSLGPHRSATRLGEQPLEGDQRSSVHPSRKLTP